ncbi:acyltransferase [Mucilaginibacter sp. ZT4R22]|uniref:Acyltransferase n=1 Tax=Mucilaginibacter pankratovii TaxID=2772110 RepID=A0ABR7WQ71_9SPHI|nr:acyltransferase [Mucilaginibacter pankratovii]MBD1363637.1 acyltransferase [Mucilaginibacter pankratovii]
MQSPAAITPKPTRYKQLDSLRGLAALCVFISHCFLMLSRAGTWVEPIKQSPLGILLNGRAAVMFFFVLSGFVLSLPFINSNRPLKLTEFYIKRVFRIYPAYLLAIVLAIILKTYVFQPGGNAGFSGWMTGFWGWPWDAVHRQEIVKTFLLIGPNFDADMIDPVIWSLVVEMKMSLLLPFFIIIVSRGNLLFNLLFFLLVLALIYNHTNGFLGVFYIGVLCAKYKEPLTKAIKALNTAWVFALLLLAMFCYNISFEFYTPWGDSAHPFAYFWRDYTNAIGGALVMMMALARVRAGNFLQQPVFNFMGDTSYSFYLLHMPLLISFSSLFGQKFQGSAAAIIVLSIILAYALSYVVFKTIEIPFQTLAKKLVAKWPLLRTMDIK